MITIKTICKECIFATTQTVRTDGMYGITELRCHKWGQAKNGFDSCDDGKDRQMVLFDQDQIDWD